MKFLNNPKRDAVNNKFFINSTDYNNDEAYVFKEEKFLNDKINVKEILFFLINISDFYLSVFLVF